VSARPLLRYAVCAAIIGMSLGLAGCAEYLDRRESLLLGAGDAVQTNIVMHQIDPWPRRARITSSTTSGERVQRAVERYRNPRSASEGPAQQPQLRAGDASQRVAP
jgi:hypothetical protein